MDYTDVIWMQVCSCKVVLSHAIIYYLKQEYECARSMVLNFFEAQGPGVVVPVNKYHGEILRG